MQHHFQLTAGRMFELTAGRMAGIRVAAGKERYGSILASMMRSIAVTVGELAGHKSDRAGTQRDPNATLRLVVLNTLDDRGQALALCRFIEKLSKRCKVAGQFLLPRR